MKEESWIENQGYISLDGSTMHNLFSSSIQWSIICQPQKHPCSIQGDFCFLDGACNGKA